MSLASRITLWTTCVVTGSIIAYVHISQFVDRENIHQGVVRDVERQERRKIENMYMLEQQIELTKQLKKEFERENQNQQLTSQ